MLKRLIIFLVRKKLGLRLNEYFQFTNQKSEYIVYYFSNKGLMKYDRDVVGKFPKRSNASLNWLLDDECEIRKVDWEDTRREWLTRTIM